MSYIGNTVHLTSEQEACLEAALSFDDPIFFAAGYAGTGKSTVLGALARLLPDAPLAAPTGKAASVVRAKTGRACSTLHQLLYCHPRERVGEDGKVELEWSNKLRPGALKGKTILLDEASMVPCQILDDLMTADARVIAFGDPGQLPPFSGGQAFHEPDFTLKTLHRQAADSPIIRQAHRVRSGKRYENDGPQFSVSRDMDWDLANAADIVLCARNASRHHINNIIREMRGYTSPRPRTGEPLACLCNDYKTGIMNGEIVTVAQDWDGDGPLVLLDGTKIRNLHLESSEGRPPRKRPGAFAFGYALTVHKAQGSEWPNVFVVDEAFGVDAQQHRYTAITRASNSVHMVRS